MDRTLMSVDVAVIGGGIAGVMTAYYLRKLGLKPAIIEKGRIAGEQSSRNWGWVRKQGRDCRELPMAIKALQLWAGLEAETGLDLGWHQGGVTYLADDDRSMMEFERWKEVAKLFQLDTKLLSAHEANKLCGTDDGALCGAMQTPSDGRAEPFTAIPAVAEYLKKQGVPVLENCAARLLDIEGGQLRGLWCEQGRIACSSAVVTGGVWTSLFLRRHGIRLPQLKVKASVMRTSELPMISQSALGHPKAAIRRRADGGYTVARSSYSTFNITADACRYLVDFKPVMMTRLNETKLRVGASLFDRSEWAADWQADEPSPFERQRVLDPEPDHKLLDQTWDAARQVFPALADGTIAQRWAGMIDVTPDEIPVIGALDQVPGLYVATGFSGHGFGIGPGAGHALAQLIARGRSDIDLQAFRISRFAEPGGVQQGDAL